MRKLIAVGASQSGACLVAYANAVQPLEGLFDAIVPIIFPGKGSDFDPAPPKTGDKRAQGSRAVSSRLRNDLPIPILAVNSESEAPFCYLYRQPDTDLLRYWEIAGSTHGPLGQVAHYAKLGEATDTPSKPRPTPAPSNGSRPSTPQSTTCSAG